MTDHLEEIIDRARHVRMDADQLRAQRLSFVYGNTFIENDRITRELVVEADATVAAESALSVAQDDHE